MDNNCSPSENNDVLKPSHHEGSVKYEGLDGETVHIGEPEDALQPPSPDKKPTSFTVDEAVELLGFGKFQIKLSILTGLAWMADAMEMTILAIVSPALQCDWGITAIEQAMITTVVFSGMMLSSTFWGNICDRFGRKTVMLHMRNFYVEKWSKIFFEVSVFSFLKNSLR
ncbi:Putative transporter [Toxocara canis]|uniref:Putative transporter n=1 Tax=Toxocara canis TaxID=6265 RepID=A0A0B2V9S3_TOXCA|nr:Putative transporter [Toxocara canis]